MSCQCEIYEICAQCAPSQEHFLKAVRDHDEVVSRQPQSSPSSPSYTLADLERLAHEYADGSDASSDLQSSGDALKFRLYLGMFIVWLGKKEREANERGIQV